MRWSTAKTGGPGCDSATNRDLEQKIAEGEFREDVYWRLDALTLDELERAYIRRVLDRTGGDKSRAAELLGIDRATLYRKLERYGERADGSR